MLSNKSLPDVMALAKELGAKIRQPNPHSNVFLLDSDGLDMVKSHPLIDKVYSTAMYPMGFVYTYDIEITFDTNDEAYVTICVTSTSEEEASAGIECVLSAAMRTPTVVKVEIEGHQPNKTVLLPVHHKTLRLVVGIAATEKVLGISKFALSKEQYQAAFSNQQVSVSFTKSAVFDDEAIPQDLPDTEQETVELPEEASPTVLTAHSTNPSTPFLATGIWANPHKDKTKCVCTLWWSNDVVKCASCSASKCNNCKVFHQEAACPACGGGKAEGGNDGVSSSESASNTGGGFLFGAPAANGPSASGAGDAFAFNGPSASGSGGGVVSNGTNASSDGGFGGFQAPTNRDTNTSSGAGAEFVFNAPTNGGANSSGGARGGFRFEAPADGSTNASGGGGDVADSGFGFKAPVASNTNTTSGGASGGFASNGTSESGTGGNFGFNAPSNGETTTSRRGTSGGSVFKAPETNAAVASGTAHATTSCSDVSGKRKADEESEEPLPKKARHNNLAAAALAAAANEESDASTVASNVSDYSSTVIVGRAVRVKDTYNNPKNPGLAGLEGIVSGPYKKKGIWKVRIPHTNKVYNLQCRSFDPIQEED